MPLGPEILLHSPFVAVRDATCATKVGKLCLWHIRCHFSPVAHLLSLQPCGTSHVTSAWLEQLYPVRLGW